MIDRIEVQRILGYIVEAEEKIKDPQVRALTLSYLFGESQALLPQDIFYHFRKTGLINILVKYGMLMMVLCDREGRVYDVWITFVSASWKDIEGPSLRQKSLRERYMGKVEET